MMFLFLFLLFCSPIAGTAESLNQCGEIDQPISFKYCITKASNSTSRDVLYYLHGAGGSELSWSKSKMKLEWENSGVVMPTVISISFGPTWLLVEKNSARASGLFEIFRDEVMPKLEVLALGKKPERRLLMGASMGGFNSAQLLFKLPQDTFSRVVFACPAFVEISPWASKEELDGFLKQIGGTSGALDGIIALVKAYVSDEKLWNQAVSPFSLLANFSKKISATLIVANEEDVYFLPGAKSFVEQAKKLGTPVSLEVFPAGHCKMNSENALKVIDFFK